MTTMTKPHAGPGSLDQAMLQGIPFFAGLGRDELADILQAGHTHRLPKDTVLFEQGDAARSLHLVLQGRVKVVQTAADGQQMVLRFVGPNELAGVLALLGPGQTYPATVAAVLDCVLLSWNPAALEVLLRRFPQVALNAMRALSGRTQEAHDRLREASAERVERRLALALLRLIRQAGVKEVDGSITIDFPLARQDLAEMAGTTLHTASRILSGWEHAGILTGGRMRVGVRDPHALVRITES